MPGGIGCMLFYGVVALSTAQAILFGHQGQPPTRVRILAETLGLPVLGYNVLVILGW